MITEQLAAIAALVELGDHLGGASVIPHLINALRNLQIYKEAANALSHFGNLPIPQLQALLLDDRLPLRCKKSVAVLLTETGWHANTQVEKIWDCLSRGDFSGASGEGRVSVEPLFVVLRQVLQPYSLNVSTEHQDPPAIARAILRADSQSSTRTRLADQFVETARYRLDTTTELDKNWGLEEIPVILSVLEELGDPRGRKLEAEVAVRSGRPASPRTGISRCRYIRCGNCGAVYAKDTILDSWRAALMFSGGTTVVSGTRTCKCGKVMQVQDIYDGAHDLPRQHWDQVQPPVEVD
jgi:hypothetical protein